MSKDGLVTLRWKDSKVVVLLINCLDPSKLTSVERRQKGTSEKLKVPCPGIIKEYNSDMNGVDMHDQLKTSNEIDRKSRFRYLHFSGISGIRYLRFFFSPMDSVVVNAHVIYKKKIDLLSFKIILAESLINRFCYQKRKITAEKPKLTVELPQPLKKPDHIVQFTEKRQRCQYCCTMGKKDAKYFSYCESCNVLLHVQKDRNCFNLYHSSWKQLHIFTICQWTSELYNIIF